jgi:hypothetical protein
MMRGRWRNVSIRLEVQSRTRTAANDATLVSVGPDRKDRILGAQVAGRQQADDLVGWNRAELLLFPEVTPACKVPVQGHFDPL